MLTEVNIVKADRSAISLVGSFVEARFSASHPFSKEYCENCVYAVRGIEGDMICLELVYKQQDGPHFHDAIYWVNILAVQYLRVLSDKEAQRRVDRLERHALDQLPRD